MRISLLLGNTHLFIGKKATHLQPTLTCSGKKHAQIWKENEKASLIKTLTFEKSGWRI